MINLLHRNLMRDHLCTPGPATARQLRAGHTFCACGFTQFVQARHGWIPVPVGGETYQISVAAATATLNYDMLTTRRDIVTDSMPRGIVSAGLTGSAAADDSSVDVKASTRIVTTLRNRTTGNPGQDTDMFKVDAFVGLDPLSAPVTDAPATNPLILALNIIRIARR